MSNYLYSAISRSKHPSTLFIIHDESDALYLDGEVTETRKGVRGGKVVWGAVFTWDLGVPVREQVAFIYPTVLVVLCSQHGIQLLGTCLWTRLALDCHFGSSACCILLRDLLYPVI
ncbi:hypothetical protein AVEN_59900-1 [Araneus ventricosus]|uniref:Uncharacterized protein n=1 Tax=Araneus ventricosus TaxID=182803 RepID=A0A4Y2EE78_ARAVE|nr:hypothetical protein AVEN_59900-1 [Araneus ventricosus]